MIWKLHSIISKLSCQLKTANFSEMSLFWRATSTSSNENMEMRCVAFDSLIFFRFSFSYNDILHNVKLLQNEIFNLVICEKFSKVPNKIVHFSLSCESQLATAEHLKMVNFIYINAKCFSYFLCKVFISMKLSSEKVDNIWIYFIAATTTTKRHVK